MQSTSKPKGLAKIWREIKRPFQRVRRYFWRKERDYENAMQQYIAKQRLLATNTIQAIVSASVLHPKTFSQFRKTHQGQDVVIVATGPTVKNYKRINGAIHIGVNRAFMIENIDLRYLFMHDYVAVESYIKEANRYKGESCTKFYGKSIPLRHTDEANALHYRICPGPNIGKGKEEKVTPSMFCHVLDSEPFRVFGSTIFVAMQFALWTDPRTIYLVGCDCSSDGYFDGQPNDDTAMPFVIDAWQQLKRFAQLHYPETKILSINPVRLKGLFDEYKQT